MAKASPCASFDGHALMLLKASPGQREIIARRLQQVCGNLYLQRLVAFLNPRTKSAVQAENTQQLSQNPVYGSVSDPGVLKRGTENRSGSAPESGQSITLTNPRFVFIPALQRVARGKKLLSKRDNGKPVKAVQTALLDIGYSLLRFHDDGKLGKETLGAVRQFREDRKISSNEAGQDDLIDYAFIGVLDSVAPPPGKSTEHFVDYDRLLADSKIEFALSIGYDEGQSHVQNIVMAHTWLESHGFKLTAGSADKGDETFETSKEVKYPGNRGQQVSKTVILSVRLITPGDGAAKKYLDSLNAAEIAMYIGHARGGLGPDFNPKDKPEENVVFGAHSKLHNQPGSNVTTPKDPYWKHVKSSATNDLEQMREKAVWDQNKYRVWMFYACTTLNYQDEFRSDLLPPGMDRRNLDIFGTTRKVPVIAGLLPVFAFIESILAGSSMEQTILSMQKSMEERLSPRSRARFRDAFYREGTADNPEATAK